jgi:hypothetical protein
MTDTSERPAAEEIVLYDKSIATTRTSRRSLGTDTFEKGLPGAVEDNDRQFPPDWRLSYSGRNTIPRR